MDLAQSLASILAPLYADIHTTFAARDQGFGGHPIYARGQA
jgi:hypothetical protein